MTAIITTFVVPQLTVKAGLGARTALVFAGCMLMTTVGSYFYLYSGPMFHKLNINAYDIHRPETKGRTLSEIDEMLRLQIPCRKWRGEYVIISSSTLLKTVSDYMSVDVVETVKSETVPGAS